jgi:hypothetical protein
MITDPKEAMTEMIGQKLENIVIRNGVATLVFERENAIVFDGEDLGMHIYVEKVN